MARRAMGPHGKIAWVEMSAEEIARVARCDEQTVRDAARFLPRPANGLYRFMGTDAYQRALKALALMRTRMPADAVANVEDAGMLDIYARLAVDCPREITAHVYRSYVAVVLAQQKQGVMLDADGLARAAALTEPDPESGTLRPGVRMARKHLMLLQAVGMLRPGDGRWEFSQWPAVLRAEED